MLGLRFWKGRQLHWSRRALLERALEYHPDNADTWLQLAHSHEDQATEGWRASAFRSATVPTAAVPTWRRDRGASRGRSGDGRRARPIARTEACARGDDATTKILNDTT